MYQGGDNMTRTSVTLTPEIEDEILRLRRTKEYCNKSKADIMRMLICRGMEKYSEKKEAE